MQVVSLLLLLLLLSLECKFQSKFWDGDSLCQTRDAAGNSSPAMTQPEPRVRRFEAPVSAADHLGRACVSSRSVTVRMVGTDAVGAPGIFYLNLQQLLLRPLHYRANRAIYQRCSLCIICISRDQTIYCCSEIQRKYFYSSAGLPTCCIPTW